MLNIVTNNPFRVLGVYSNARPADIVSNCDEMEAYLAIGQSVAFDLDFNKILPQVIRTAQTVHNAKQQINLPIEKLKYALFWFVKDPSSDHAMNYLKNGNFINADSVFDINNSFASRINKAVTALMQNDLGSAIANVTKMIHDLDKQGFRDDFVKAICGNIFSINEDDLAHLFIDTLLEEKSVSELKDLFKKHGVSPDDDDYLTDKVKDELISRIYAEIAKVKAIKQNDANANLRAGKALMTNTKSDLEKVKSLLSNTDMKYQLLADDLANAILQCGINYYNNTNDDDDIDKAMELQNYACKIAVGKLCKDRCDKNLKILEKKKEEKTIEVDMAFIANQLEAFQSKSNSIDNAKNLIVNCKPHLDSIKKQLGSQNNTYLQISSAVANNALGMLINIVNQNNDSKSMAQNAMTVIDLIATLDIDYSTKTRINKNRNILSNNIANMPSGFEKVNNATGGCLELIGSYLIWAVVFAAIAGLVSLCS